VAGGGSRAWRDGGCIPYLSMVCHTLDTSGCDHLHEPRRVELKGTGMYDLCGPDTVTPYGVTDFWTERRTLIGRYHAPSEFRAVESYGFLFRDTTFVVGGLVESISGVPWVIVYEFNGEFWREPGDTTGLAPMGGQSADDGIMPPPTSFILAAYPNPFNGEVTLQYDLARTAEVNLRVFNLLGERGGGAAQGRNAAGTHVATWRPEVGSGIYYLRLDAGT